MAPPTCGPQATAAELIAMAAHELRTPLAGLVGLLRALDHDGRRLPARIQATYVTVALAQAEQAQRLARAMLTAAQQPHPGVIIGPRTMVDVGALARRTLQVMRLAHRDCVIVGKVVGRLPVRADPDAVVRAMYSLLDNAVRYGPSQGPVWVTATRERDQVVFAIEDAGPGVALEDRDRIFERFTRGTAARAGGTGLGIGLWVARALARAHNGDITISSPTHPDSGARFELRLPATNVSAGAIRQPSTG